jgi:hypothetical protein
MNYKFKNWNGQDLEGSWLFTIKIDGVQAIKGNNGSVVTKRGKPLYNLPKTTKDFEVAEIFCGSWNKTMSIIRASKSKRRKIRPSEIYPLFPNPDRRLILGRYVDPPAAFIRKMFLLNEALGHEGLVLRGQDVLIKVKSDYTEDLVITGMVEGKGRLKGKLGKLETLNGEVGTGFTDQERGEIWASKEALIGTYVEVKYTEKTKNNKLRNPRFIRLRPDK